MKEMKIEEYDPKKRIEDVAIILIIAVDGLFIFLAKLFLFSFYGILLGLIVGAVLAIGYFVARRIDRH